MTVRTQQCTKAQARRRLDHAKRFLEVGELVSAETEPEYASVAAALAVLAGIAACDAACCQALGRRARGHDHHEAEELVGEIDPGGRSAAASLRRVVNLKDEAHYGLFDVGGQDVKAALRQARSLVKFAERVLER
jgi:hypothetical protein